uniref:Uncharacterized protein n=1 Tax=Caenorhabditis japonica TaxID=281687 RepID=A0A8R1E119_CAEJA
MFSPLLPNYFLCFIVLFVVFANSEKHLIDLKSFKGGVETKIDADTLPFSIYVSASSNDSDSLKQIYVYTTDDGVKSLYDLQKMKYVSNSGLLQPFVVNSGDAWISTQLTDEQMDKLRGYLYVTTTKQLKSRKRFFTFFLCFHISRFKDTNGFFVFDVTMSEKIEIDSLQSDDVTLVFLNTNFDTYPWQSSIINSWSQGIDSTVFIYEGVPTDDVEKSSSQMFSNPVVTASGDIVPIPKVEKFSLSLGAFYVKIHKGVNFIIEPGYVELDGFQTTAMTTTGVYMKPFNVPDKNITIVTLHDPKYNGTVGMNIVGHVPDNSQVGLYVDNGQQDGAPLTPTDQAVGFDAFTIGQNITIKPNGTTAGEFCVQYYVIQGNQQIVSSTILPGRQSTAGPTIKSTENPIESTTKSTAFTKFLICGLIPVLGAIMC